jgi:serine/threonine protein kinase
MAENPILNDRYRLIEQVGSGGMAVIYKAQDLDLNRMVAVKVLRPSLVSDPEFLMRFRREAQAAANLSHPNIVTVHDVGQDGPKTHYIVMEFVSGQNLKKLIRARGAFEVDPALSIIIEVCKGVGYAHRAGLVHCDIKPQNILVTPENSIKVVDFGIARAFSAARSGDEVEDVVWGSPHYFSPEQAAGQPPTPASDVYSIGVVLFELLTGRLPFTGQDYQELALAHLKQDPPSIIDVNPALPQELDRIVRKLMAKEPATRYRTADQLGRILTQYRQQGEQPTTSSFIVKPSSVTPPSPPRPDDTIPSPATRQALSGEPTMSAGPTPRARANTEPYSYPTFRSRYYPGASDAGAVDDYYDEEFVPGVDVYGIVLGVLAAVAVLGLIPLWLTILLTFTR